MRKQIAILLSVIIVFVSMASTNTFAVDVDGRIFTFEDYETSTSALPKGWLTSRTIGSTAGVFTSRAEGGLAGTVVSAKNVNSAQDNVDLYYKFDNPYSTGEGSGYLSISYDVMVPASANTSIGDYTFYAGFLTSDQWMQQRWGGTYNPASGYRGLVQNGTNVNQVFVPGYLAFYKPLVIKGGNYGYATGSSSENNFTSESAGNVGGSAEKNVWYTVDTQIDLSTRRVTAFVNGVKYVDGVTFGRDAGAGGAYPSTPVDGIGFRLVSTVSNRNVEFYLDNVYYAHTSAPMVKSFAAKSENVAVDSEYINVIFSEYLTKDNISADEITLKNLKTGEYSKPVSVQEYNHRAVKILLNSAQPMDFTTKYEISFGSGIESAVFETEIASVRKYYCYEDFENYISNEQSGFKHPEGWSRYIEDGDPYENGQLTSGFGVGGGNGLYITAKSNHVGIKKLFDKPIEDLSVFTVEFDMLSTGGGVRLYLLPESKNDADTIVPFNVASAEESSIPITATANNRTNSPDKSIGLDYTAFGEWTHVSVCVKIGASSVDIDYKVGGQTASLTNIPYKSTASGATPLTDVGGIAFAKLQNAAFDDLLALDNIRVYKGTADSPEKAYVPVVRGLRFENHDGMVTDKTDAVWSTTTKIILTFNVEMNLDSLCDTLSLRDFAGNEVLHTLSVSGTECIISLDHMLSPATEYTLEIDSLAQSADKITLGESYYVGYSSLNDGSFFVKDISVKKGANIVSVSSLSENDVLTQRVTFVKTNRGSEKYTLFYFDYYKNVQSGILVLNNAAFRAVEIAANDVGLIEIEMPITVKNAGQVSNIKGFLWRYPSNSSVAECAY